MTKISGLEIQNMKYTAKLDCHPSIIDLRGWQE
jgi:hypothetical protein